MHRTDKQILIICQAKNPRGRTFKAAISLALKSTGKQNPEGPYWIKIGTASQGFAAKPGAGSPATNHQDAKNEDQTGFVP